MEHSGEQTGCVHNQAVHSSSCSCAPNHSKGSNSSPPMREIHHSPYSSPATSHSSATIDSTLGQSPLDTSTDAPSKSSKRDRGAYRSQTSLSPLLARAHPGTSASVSSPSSSKIRFLKAIFDRKRKDSKQASQGSLDTAASSSQASSNGAQGPPYAPGSSLQKRNDAIQQQQPQISFADLAYRYGGPSSKPPRL